MLWSERINNHIYVYHNGNLIYKRWIDKNGNKTEPSMIFNIHWPNEKIFGKT